MRVVLCDVWSSCTTTPVMPGVAVETRALLAAVSNRQGTWRASVRRAEVGRLDRATTGWQLVGRRERMLCRSGASLVVSDAGRVSGRRHRCLRPMYRFHFTANRSGWPNQDSTPSTMCSRRGKHGARPAARGKSSGSEDGRNGHDGARILLPRARGRLTTIRPGAEDSGGHRRPKGAYLGAMSRGLGEHRAGPGRCQWNGPRHR